MRPAGRFVGCRLAVDESVMALAHEDSSPTLPDAAR